MKRLITVLALTSFFFTVHAQQLDFDTVVKAEDDVSSFEEYLVYLAWLNSPISEAAEYRKNIARIQVKEAKLGWLETFTPFVNYSFGNSEGTNTPIIGGTTMPDPMNDTPMTFGIGESRGVGIGMSFRLLPLFTNKHKVAAAKENIKIVLSEVNNTKLNLRAQVLGRYFNYVYGAKAIEERVKTESDTEESYKLILELFKKDLAQFEDVNNASTAYHKATEERLRAELETKNAKILLEEYIGISLEEATLMYEEKE